MKDYGRHIVFFIENTKITDGEDFIPLVVQTLMEYINAVENKKGGFEGVEVMFSGNGNKLTVVAQAYEGAVIPNG